jgi:flagellar protein FlaJ
MSEGSSFSKGKVLENPERDRYDIEKERPSDLRSQYDGLAYAIFGKWFEDKKDKWWYNSVEKRLTQAQFGISPSLFLSRSSLTISIIGVLLLFISFILLFSVFIAGLIPGFLLPMLGVVIIGGIFYVMIGYSTAYLYLLYKVSKREKRIEKTFPYGVTFIYAMSRGGVSFPETVKTLARSDNSYGEISNEFKPVVQEMKYFSTDLPHALRNAGRRSPSEKYTNFVNDLVGIIESGADLTGFLNEKAEDYLEEAEREQKSFLDNLGIIGEVYVTAFLAAPLFIIIILVIMNMLGGGGVSQLVLFVYLGVTFANIGFFFFISAYTPDDAGIESTIPLEKESLTYEKAMDKYGHLKGKSSSIDRILTKKKRRESNEFIYNPKKTLIENPGITLYATLPLAAVYFLIMLSAESFPLNLESMYSNPALITGIYLIIPMFLTLAPISVLHEIKYKKKNSLLNKLPGSLQQLAGTNSIGMTLTEGLETVRRTTSGRLKDEIRKVRNDINWYHDINRGMKKFANRVEEPILVRTVKLITEANKATGDIADVLDVASRDVKQRQRMKKDRKSEMGMYTAVIIMSFVIYVFVVLMLDSAFLSRIEELGQQTAVSEQAGQTAPAGGGGAGSLNLSSVPVDKYRTIFYHSTVIQGLGAGLIAGYLTTNRVKAGLKYSLALVAVSTLAFLIFA